MRELMTILESAHTSSGSTRRNKLWQSHLNQALRDSGHHRGVAATDEGGRIGLYALLVHRTFDINPSATAATYIEHIVALAETHDGGIADDCCSA